MNQLVTAFAVTATLRLAQGCSLSAKSGETPAVTTTLQGRHSMDGMEMPEMSSTAHDKFPTARTLQALGAVQSEWKNCRCRFLGECPLN